MRILVNTGNSVRIRFCLLAWCFIALQSARLQAADAKPKLSPDKLKEVSKLLAQYRAKGTDIAKKQDICRQVLFEGPAAAPLMLATVERDLKPQIKQYLSKFEQRATAMAKTRMSKVDFNKVAELRTMVLGLQKQGDAFTHELITAKADPAMAQLRQWFIMQRTDVLDKSPDLAAERKKMTPLGEMWDQCHAQVGASSTAKNATPATSFEDYIVGEEGDMASAATQMDAKTQAIFAANARLAPQIDREEARTITACNITRGLLGLPVLAIDLRLCETARDHSHDMETLKFFAHESPVEGKKTPWDRAKRMGTTASAENIFMGISDGNKANEGWFHSPGHHKNMLSKAVRIGVGRSGKHFTEMFGG